jgi:beta-glucosidase
MKEWLQARKARKKKIVAEVKKDRIQLKEEKAAIMALPQAEQEAAKKVLKQKQKAKKVEYKEQLQTADKAQKKQLKKEHRLYKKIKNRPRRGIIWSVIVLAILTIVVKVGPTVKDMAETMSGKGIELAEDSKASSKARSDGEKVSEKIADEGIVLLKNEQQSLPLADKKVNVFGVSSFGFRYGGGGSGGSDTSRAISLYDGLEEAGLAYNKDLYDFYMERPEVKDTTGKSDTGLMAIAKMMVSKEDGDEPEIDYLTKDIVKQATDYSQNAVIVLASAGVESSDMDQSQLKLTENKKALIKQVAENFENVTIVINSGNTLELGYLEEFPTIRSIVWVGTPGPYGTRSLGNVLAGKINPSGRLTDTYAYQIDSAPASENFGSYKYDNLDKHFVNYQEGIYIGYRFYETFYEQNEAGYEKAVQFPYGYGLSYTNFDWKLVDTKMNEKTISLDVEVTNIGESAGKDVLQLYFSAPYTKNGIEKSAIELGAYGKTKLLKPNEKEIVTLTFSTNDMASYDMNDKEAYVLEEGTYKIKLGKNVHDITETVEYHNPKEIVIKEDAQTGTQIQNQFEKNANEQTYLSRNDWEKTYPSDDNLNYTAPTFVLDEVNKQRTDSKMTMPKFEQENGIKLEDLKDLSYDDPKWDDFLAQFSVEELMDFYTQGAYKTNAVERLGVPATVLLDGPAGINFFFKPVKAAAYPTEIVIASTWNDQLAYEWGQSVGKEARAMGVHGWYAPAMNIHRTAQGGRNFEYFSEDPLLSGKMAASVTKGSQDQGVIVFIKHFAMNDQETNARSGLYVWANEQAMRELHLKPFEIAVKEGGTYGAMSSFSFLNGQWAGANSTLLNDVLRKEWGFEGIVSSDAVFGFMHADDAVVSGNDLMLDIMSKTANKKRLKQAYKKDPSGIANGLKTSAHNALYAILQTYIFEK